jgi:YVTN family beta-propeller protein
MTRRLCFILLTAVLLASGAVLAVGALDPREGRIGPDSRIQPSGRRLDPAGRLTQPLGNFPAGGALTQNGRFLWSLSAGRGANDIRIVETEPALRCRSGRRGRACRRTRLRRTGRVVQTLPMPGLSGGIAMARDNRTAYVSGVPESTAKDQKVGDAVPGREGDVIHVLRYDGRTGQAKRDGVIAVPPPSAAPSVQNFPPQTRKASWPRDLALSPDGDTLVAALNLADHAAIVDTRTRAVRYVKVGGYPYGAAVTRDGRSALVSNEADGTVSVIDLSSAKVTKTITVGPRLSHPEAIAVDPKSDRAYVAVAHQDLVAVIDTGKMEVERTLSVGRPEGIGTMPTALSVSRDGRRLLVSDSGEDAIAVFNLPQEGSDYTRRRELRTPGARAVPVPKDFELIGRIPVAAYPVGAFATPKSKKLVWLAGKGLGVGPNPRGPSPTNRDDTDDFQSRYQYLPRMVTGIGGVLTFPSDERLRRYTPRASQQIRPVNDTPPPPGSPIAPPGPSTKIKHVFYVVRENRTYDQVLGDDERGDGDPKLTVFGPDVTPNAHALARRFPLLDHVYANSEASIDGHFWTSAAAVSDYVVKSWMQNYAGRGRPYDFGVYSVTWPAKRFLFDRAEEDGVSWFNFGEAIAGNVPLPDRSRTAAEDAEVQRRLAKSDLGQNGCFPNVASSGGTDVVVGASGQRVEVYDSSLPQGAPPGSQSRFQCFKTRFDAWVAAGSVPQFVYATFANDHTSGTRPGERTPKAMVAENDLALGQVVDLISHSPIWKESLILVIEDDSQNGADHVDAHRIPAFAISPYAKKGAVVHTRYDFLSFIRTLEIAVGMKPMNLFDATAVPLYDAFTPGPDNAEPYGVLTPKQPLLERNTEQSPGAALSKRARIGEPGRTDEVSQRLLDRVIWQSVHGADSEPPPPGPNASAEDEEEYERHMGGTR